ncbi:MAG: hypothetical protein ACSHYB_07845 [Roseibacillus sp.]
MNSPKAPSPETLKKLHEDSERQQAKERADAAENRKKAKKATKKATSKTNRQKGAKKSRRKKAVKKEREEKKVKAKMAREEIKSSITLQRALPPEKKQELIDKLKRPFLSLYGWAGPDIRDRRLVHSFESGHKELELAGWDKIGETWAKFDADGFLVFGPCKSLVETVGTSREKWKVPSYHDGEKILPFPVPPPEAFWKKRWKKLPESYLEGELVPVVEKLTWDDDAYRDAEDSWRESLLVYSSFRGHPVDFLARYLGNSLAPDFRVKGLDVVQEQSQLFATTSEIKGLNQKLKELGLFDGDSFYSDSYGSLEDEHGKDAKKSPRERVDTFKNDLSKLAASDPRKPWVDLFVNGSAGTELRAEIQALLLRCFVAGRQFERVLSKDKSKVLFSQYSKLKIQGEKKPEVRAREQKFAEILALRIKVTGSLNRFGPTTAKKFLKEQERDDLLAILEMPPANAFKNFLRNERTKPKSA